MHTQRDFNILSVIARTIPNHYRDNDNAMHTWIMRCNAKRVRAHVYVC